jgi:hypothetical protein
MPDSEANRGQGQGQHQHLLVHPESHLLLAQTREPGLGSPALPTSTFTVAMAAPAWSSLSGSASPAASSPPSSEGADSGDTTPQGSDPAEVADARPPSLVACDYASPIREGEQGCKAASSQTRRPGIEDTVDMSRGNGGVLVYDQHQHQDQPMREIADQAAVTPTKVVPCYARVSPVPLAPSTVASCAAPEFEWNSAAAKEDVVMGGCSAGTLVVSRLRAWDARLNLDRLPNEVLMHILGFLEVCDLLATSRVSWLFLFL